MSKNALSRGYYAIIGLAYATVAFAACPVSCPGSGAANLSAMCVETDPAGAPPRSIWSEQPTRASAPGAPTSSTSSLGSIVECDPAKIGSYPVPEGGNTNAKGADLQNISTNFHVIQSMQLLASAMSKAAAKLGDFQSDVNKPFQPGRCLCKGAVSNPSSATLAACLFTDKTREECDQACAAGQTPALDPQCIPGPDVLWLPNDIFKDETSAAKFALELMGQLDNLKDFTNSDMYTAIHAVLILIGSDIKNVNEIIAKMACWTDLFTEGYHLGGYSDQRPDLHQCIGYLGHGAYAHLGQSNNFDIGGRYASHQLSKSHRSQMRTGGFAVTAFGKTLSILPGIEFNTQIDGYRMFNGCAPLGIDALGDASLPSCNITPTYPPIYVGNGSVPAGDIDVNKVDIFSLVDRSKVKELDSNNDDILAPGEFLAASYSPYNYTSAVDGMSYVWPRPQVTEPFEGKSAAVFSAGVNIDPAIDTIEKFLPTIVVYPGVTVTPVFTLDASSTWIHEAYKFRTRLQDSINKNLPASQALDTADFNRDMHAMQGPDVSADNGTRVDVAPGVKALIVVGIPINSRILLGILASIGLKIDIIPGGYGGVVDLSRGLVEGLNASNPPSDLPCSPVISTTLGHTCSNNASSSEGATSDADTSATYSCDPPKTTASATEGDGSSASDCEEHGFQCIPTSDIEATSWEGAGCHPLNQGFPSACGCGADTDCSPGETCDLATSQCAAGNCEKLACAQAGTCTGPNGIPYAETLAFQAANPVNPMHAIESYALTDIEILAFLLADIELGVKIKLFGKLREFSLWKWDGSWDIGSTQKSHFQAGLEATYQDECNGIDEKITNHQPGSWPSCSMNASSLVCRYSDSSKSDWSTYDSTDELIAYCTDQLPQHAENPQAPTGADFGNAFSDIVDFGTSIGETTWASSQLCVDGMPLTQWPTNLGNQFMNGNCTYTGITPGAAATFPCNDMDNYLLQIWGCVNTPGLGYLPTVATMYTSSLTTGTVVSLSSVVADISISTALNPSLFLTTPQQIQTQAWVAGVSACFDAHSAQEPQPFVAYGGGHFQLCCGDAVLQPGEECDDGNTLSGDGCSRDCHSEKGGSACCFPGGCSDQTSATDCTKKDGTIFSGKLCSELDSCGNATDEGACILVSGECRSPATSAWCILHKGKFQTSCPVKGTGGTAVPAAVQPG